MPGDAAYRSQMSPNRLVAGALPQTPLWEYTATVGTYTAPPDLLAGGEGVKLSPQEPYSLGPSGLGRASALRASLSPRPTTLRLSTPT